MMLRRLLLPLFLTTALTVSRAQEEKIPTANPDVIEIKSRASLIHLGSLDSFDVTQRGKDAAKRILDFIEKGDRSGAEEAVAIFKEIIPDENFGGEYTALQWLMECELASEEDRQQKFLPDPLVQSFRGVLANDNWSPLRSFIRDKYHIDETPEDLTDRTKLAETKRRNRFLEDFILFANPRRDAWEKSSKMIAALNLKPGDKVADVGCGPGFFSFSFGRLVGETGKVFAIDNNPDHLSYLKQTIETLKIPNVIPVMPGAYQLGITEQVDLVFLCSLYHNLYAILTDQQRDALMISIKKSLKPGGKLVLVDNTPTIGTLPYHGPYIARELLISQLTHHGFKFVEGHQFIPQRYMLIFTMEPGAAERPISSGAAKRPPIPAKGLIARSLKEMPPTPGVAAFVDGSPERIRVLSQRSLLATLIAGTSPTFSKAGRTAAEAFLDALETKDRKKLTAVRATYKDLMAKERTGDEYSSFLWFIDYLLTPEKKRAALIAKPLVADYFNFFGGEDFKRMKTYLRNKYLLGDFKKQLEDLEKKRGDVLKAKGAVNEGLTKAKDETVQLERDEAPPYQDLQMEVDVRTLIVWWEYMAYSNPQRDVWEKSNQMVDYIGIKPGFAVADVGSGSGFYTFKFSEKVGAKGKVFALDLGEPELENLRRAAGKLGLANIETVVSKEDDTTLPENSIDVAWLCSLYHATYVTSMEYVKDRFITSLRKSLKPGGKLVIVDNEPMPADEGGYYGPRIAKELLIAQLAQYGFKFSSFAQFVPQRYVLVFEVNKTDDPAKP